MEEKPPMYQPPQQQPMYPQGQQPQYPVAQPQQIGMVTMGVPATNTVIVQNAVRPPSYMWLACLVFWFCNWVFGFIAFILSLISASNADEGNMEGARSMGKASMWTSIAGVISGVVIIIIIIVYFVKFYHSVASTTCSYYYGTYTCY